MRFSPQRRTIFQHLNFKKWSETVSFLSFWLGFFNRSIVRHQTQVFCTFWLGNMLLATALCNFSTDQFFNIWTDWLTYYLTNFSTAQLQKVVRACSVLYIFTPKCASRHSGVLFLISPLTTWLRTRRFNEPTFRLTGHTNHWKNTAFRDFSNIWRGWIFFLLPFALLHLLSSDSTASSDFTFCWLYFIYLFFICFSSLHIVGSLLFKLPSIIHMTCHKACTYFNVYIDCIPIEIERESIQSPYVTTKPPIGRICHCSFSSTQIHLIMANIFFMRS